MKEKTKKKKDDRVKRRNEFEKKNQIRKNELAQREKQETATEICTSGKAIGGER